MTDTSDRDQRDLLVRSYVDGELDPAGRAEVDADPELAAQVRAQQALRRLLSEPVTVDPEQRERAIAAALSAFESSAPVAPPVASLAARRRNRWLLPAAAAIVVAFAGAVLVLGGDGSDDDLADESAVLSESEQRAETPAAATFAAGAEEGSLSVLDDSGGADVPSTLAAPAEAEEATAAELAVPETLPRLRSADELAAFAAGLLTSAGAAEATVAGDAAATPSVQDSPCPDVVALVELDVGGGARVVAVRIEADAGEVVALDSATCSEVLRAPLP